MCHIKKAISFLLLTALIFTSTLPAYAATYKYDPLGRLIEVAYSSGQTITYTYDAMGNMTTVVASDEPADSGYTVSGKIRSYNPKSRIDLQLFDGIVEKYKTTIEPEPGSGQKEQPFTFKDVKPGTYTLVITKTAHLKFTVNKVIVGEGDLDLQQDPREAVKLITLISGDLNGDGQINSGDLLILLSYYLELGEKILADLNGDGQVNSSDLLILLGNYLELDVVVD